MARPHTMNAAFGEFIQLIMGRFLERAQGSGSYVPTEEEANVLKRLAETQTILMKGRPLDENTKPLTKRTMDIALRQLENGTEATGEYTPPAEGDPS